MPSPSPRRPSTLAADRFRAAQRPLGVPVEPSRERTGDMMPGQRPSMRGGSVAASGFAARGGRAATPDLPRSKPTPAPSTASAAREQRDNVFVTSIVVAFVFLTMAIAGVKVSGSMRQDRSRTAITGTLSKVYEQQTAFRILNQRFATWPELEARGMALPEQQRVVASNASRSHWFMSVRDTSTGIVCSRTGELFDDSPFDRTPSCSGVAR